MRSRSSQEVRACGISLVLPGDTSARHFLSCFQVRAYTCGNLHGNAEIRSVWGGTAEVVPRLVPDHQQLALDDDRLRHVEALVRLAGGELEGTQHTGRTPRGLDLEVTVNVVHSAARHEDEAAVALSAATHIGLTFRAPLCRVRVLIPVGQTTIRKLAIRPGQEDNVRVLLLV